MAISTSSFTNAVDFLNQSNRYLTCNAARGVRSPAGAAAECHSPSCPTSLLMLLTRRANGTHWRAIRLRLRPNPSVFTSPVCTPRAQGLQVELPDIEPWASDYLHHTHGLVFCFVWRKVAVYHRRINWAASKAGKVIRRTLICAPVEDALLDSRKRSMSEGGWGGSRTRREGCLHPYVVYPSHLQVFLIS